MDIIPELNNKEYIKNIYDLYDVHFCGENEVDELVAFIDNYWRKRHVFVLSRELLNWQHYDEMNKRYNFVIAKNRLSGEIHSILGFVPTYQFDHNIKNIEVWLCIWKSREDIHIKGLGSSLVYFLKSNLDISAIVQMGISEINAKISEKWGFKTGVADHYYFANRMLPDQLSQHRKYKNDLFTDDESWEMKPLDCMEFSKLDQTSEILCHGINKYKSKHYYINRYFNHPIYKYEFFSIRNRDDIQTILITRKCENAEGKCLRIIDVIGCINGIRKAQKSLTKLMKLNQYEYIDFVSAGLSSEVMLSTGFINRRENKKTIIPHYFEPFLKKNVEIRYAYKTLTPEDVQIFKGDADQDRPNAI